MPIRLFIIDDQPLILNGLKSLLTPIPNIAVIGIFNSGDALLMALKENKPDVMLLDMQMPGLSGGELVRIIRAEYPEIGILILTGESTASLAQYMLQQGCKGFLSKNTTNQDTLIEAIMSAYEGKVFIDPDIKELLLYKMLNVHDGNEGPSTISGREQEVLQFIAQGLKSQEIANKLSIGVRTVDTYRQRLMIKLKVKNIPALIKTALDLKLIK